MIHHSEFLAAISVVAIMVSSHDYYLSFRPSLDVGFPEGNKFPLSKIGLRLMMRLHCLFWLAHVPSAVGWKRWPENRAQQANCTSDAPVRNGVGLVAAISRAVEAIKSTRTEDTGKTRPAKLHANDER